MKDIFLGMTVHVHHKGGNSQAEMNKANDVQKQLDAIQTQMLQQQQAAVARLTPINNAIIDAGGMLPAQEAAMRSAALNNVGAGEQQAIGSINQSLVARGLTGGNMAGGGGVGRDFSALQQGLLGNEMQGLQNVQLAKGQGLQQALATGLGIGGMYGSQALGFGQQAIGALGQGVTAANAADQAQTGFWGSLIGGLAGLGSAGIGKI